MMQNKTVKLGNIVIKQKNRFFDVFSGAEGWHESTWTRFLLVGNGKDKLIKFVKGVSLDPMTFSKVQKAILEV